MREMCNDLLDNRPITSLCVVEEVAKCPMNFTVVSRTYDQDVDADLYKEWFFRRVTRYLCYSKTEGYLGYVVEQLQVLSEREPCPSGYTPIPTTLDTNQKAFKKKQLCFKALSKSMAKQVITDIIILSNSRVAPEGFSLAGEMNGMSICYRVGPAPSPSATSPATPLPYQIGPHGAGGRTSSSPSLYPGLERPSRPAPAPPSHAVSPQHLPYQSTATDTYDTTQSALYGVPFHLNKKYVDCEGSSPKEAMPTLNHKSAHLIESLYYYSFSLEQDVLQRSSNA